MKKNLMTAITIAAIGFYAGYVLSEYQLAEQEQYLTEILENWEGFEEEYRDDIARIDDLRQDLSSLENERAGWERLTFEFKGEAEDYKMERNKYYTMLIENGIKVIGTKK